MSSSSLLLLLSFILLFSLSSPSSSSVPHRNPDSVANEVLHQIKTSHSRFLLEHSRKSLQSQCLTGNPIDDCWRCSGSDPQRLADCALGFGRNALGGKGGQLYTVTDSSDSSPDNPKPGTLRHAASQPSPVWITFASDMTIKLSAALRVTSFTTIDGRGANVHIAGGPCIVIREVTNVIVHNVHVHNCVPGDGSDGDAISVETAKNVWIDHCTLSNCYDGLIDVTLGSTGVTISNNFFSHHDKVMLLGHNDDYLADSGMQVTVAFNRFGDGLVQRMPRARRGYVHVVNNDYAPWGMYAIGGSANPTINSQGNRFVAPSDSTLKEVTKRIDVDQSEWKSWNWRSEGDMMVNGAFFVASGSGYELNYAKAESTNPIPAAMIDQITMNAGVLTETSANTGPGCNGPNCGGAGGGPVCNGPNCGGVGGGPGCNGPNCGGAGSGPVCNGPNCGGAGGGPGCNGPNCGGAGGGPGCNGPNCGGAGGGPVCYGDYCGGTGGGGEVPGWGMPYSSARSSSTLSHLCFFLILAVSPSLYAW